MAKEDLTCLPGGGYFVPLFLYLFPFLSKVTLGPSREFHSEEGLGSLLRGRVLLWTGQAEPLAHGWQITHV